MTLTFEKAGDASGNVTDFEGTLDTGGHGLDTSWKRRPVAARPYSTTRAAA